MSTNPVLEKMGTYFSDFFRNMALTGSHRVVSRISGGTCGAEQASLDALYRKALALWHEHPASKDDSGDLLTGYFAEQLGEMFQLYEANNLSLSPALETIITTTFYEFTQSEPSLFKAPPEPPQVATTTLEIQSRAARKLKRYIKHNRVLEQTMRQWILDVANFMFVLLSELKLPPVSDTDAPPFLELQTVMLELAREPATVLDICYSGTCSESATEDEYFQSIFWKLFFNFKDIIGRDPRTKPAVTIEDYMRKNFSIDTADRYLSGTPFHTLLMSHLPIPVPEEVRFEHMHVLAGSGHGKTQTLQHLIVQDLQRPPDQVPSMVILDSQGDMIGKLKRLSLFDPTIEGSLARRLLIVDPSDVEFAPSLNLFDIQSDRLQDYNQKDREQVLAGIIEIYDYIFGGLLGAELTQKQSVVFRFLAQLMLSIPGSTIHTLRDLLMDASPYMEHVAKLPDTARGFFETQFFTKGYAATREQILRRLYGVLQNPSFERMFASKENRLDLFDTLNEGGIVLVNTAKDFMKTEASSMFGRYIIALTFKAAMERAILPEQQRRPTFLWIDEASEYFDDNIDSLLIQARKYKLGLVMAHQYLGQLPRGLPASLMTNTSIKLVGGVSDKDAREMAREMHTTPEFVASMSKERHRASFAAYVRNITPQAMKLMVSFGTVESLPKMPSNCFDVLMSGSRDRLSSPHKKTPVQRRLPETKQTASTDLASDQSDFWQEY